MSLLKSLTKDASIQDETDTLGGGGTSGPVESGLYKVVIETAYISTSTGGAMGLVLQFKTEAANIVRQTMWMTSGKAKGGTNYYMRGDEKFYLPGFLHADSLAHIITGKNINELDTETKVIGLYDFAARKEVPTKVEMVMELVGKAVIIGLIKQTVDKNVKDDNGDYVPSGETRDENELDKLFQAETHLTAAEIKLGATEAKFMETWGLKWSSITRDRSTKGVVPPVKKVNASPTISLFA